MEMICCEQMRDTLSEEQIELVDADSAWGILGCCGGGCYVMNNVRYCPYCGTELPLELEQCKLEEIHNKGVEELKKNHSK